MKQATTMRQAHISRQSRAAVRATGLIGLVCVAVLSGCAWVETTPRSEKVRIVPQDRVRDCTLRGTINAGTKPQVIGLTRNLRVVTQEVDDLARLEAVDLNADTIVPLGPVDNGARSYRAYRCLGAASGS